MTEQEWLVCTDPQPMLAFLGQGVSERKLRLFAVACCRRISHLITDERSRHGVEVAERFADGLVDEAEMTEADLSAGKAAQRPHGPPYDERWSTGCASQAVAFATCDWAMFYEMDAQNTVHWTRHALADRRGFDPLEWEQRQRMQETFNETGRLVADLVRDLIGNPFHPAAMKTARLTLTVTNLAQAAYDERTLPSGDLDLARLAVLADALEEAGCDNADILNHLRGPGAHVRGCWVLDLILGKN